MIVDDSFNTHAGGESLRPGIKIDVSDRCVGKVLRNMMLARYGLNYLPSQPSPVDFANQKRRESSQATFVH